VPSTRRCSRWALFQRDLDNPPGRRIDEEVRDMYACELQDVHLDTVELLDAAQQNGLGGLPQFESESEDFLLRWSNL
jgi:hypothetical protein